MATNNILKTIKINVDSKEYQALLKSIKELEKLEEKINNLRGKGKEAQKERIKLLEEQLKLLKKEDEHKRERIQTELKILKLEQQRLKVLNDIEKKQAAARFTAAKEAIQAAPLQRAKERQREEWEKDRATPAFTRAMQIKNWRSGGLFEMAADISEERGAQKVAGIEEQIAQQQDVLALNQEEREYLEKTATRTKSGEISKKSKEWKRLQELKQSDIEAAEKIEELKDERSQTIGKTKTQVGTYQALAKGAAALSSQFSKLAHSVLNLVTKPFKQLTDAVMGTVKAMLDFKSGIATYSMGTSLVTNAAARETQLKYGLSSSSTYGFTKAKEMLNIQSDEDLMYMNKDQRDRFLQYMEKYSQFYNKMESSGVLASIQEMQLEFAELKEELAMEFLQWVAENKDTIMACIKGIFEVIKTVANMIMNIVNFFTGTKGNNYDLYEKSNASDTYNNNNSRNTNITINANTTNNATGVLGSKEALDKFNDENWSQLAKQVVGVIGG